MTLAKYRHKLPQLNGHRLLTDGGLETTLIFHDGIDLPHFAAFDLLRTTQGRAALKAYYRRYARIATAQGLGFVLDSPTWRASRDWGDRLGYSRTALEAVNREAIDLMFELRTAHDTAVTPFVVSGNIGPRGDGYQPETIMSAAAAQAYHAEQIATFAAAGVDMVSAFTMTHAEEAIGIARAASAAGVPAVLSFTVETDGRLPSGQGLGAAIEQVDAETGASAAYFMINCAHPTHFEHTLVGGAAWTRRIRGLRANASRLSHAELDAAETLDDGNPQELGEQYAALLAHLPELTVLGGCCGTDHRHVKAIGTCCHHRQAA